MVLVKPQWRGSVRTNGTAVPPSASAIAAAG
jgi:hypothetical protein